MAQQDDVTGPRTVEGHRTSTAEAGRFCLARCSCGWRGPARRARSKARSDVEAHLADAAGAHGD
ncbi:hypothetical protein [Streptomyces sp. NPDC050560]|uniref:hypothetical protein n=1 Tax=Streptomyces sp. NPDC050560 TaxID=3365630 RepID=UPI00379856D1